MFNYSSFSPNTQEKLSKKRCFLFDLDGTLLDSVHVWNLVDSKLIASFGKTAPALTLCQSDRDRELSKHAKEKDPYLAYCGWLKDFYDIEDSAEVIQATRQPIADLLLTTEVKLKAGAAQFLKALKREGATLAITTTTGRINIARYRDRNPFVGGLVDFNSTFDLILTRNDVRHLKPHPEIYLEALERLNIAREETLVFEDSLAGSTAASLAGLDVLSIKDKHSEHERAKIDALSVGSFNQFTELLK